MSGQHGKANPRAFSTQTLPTANHRGNQLLGKSGHGQALPTHGPSPRERGETKES